MDVSPEHRRPLAVPVQESDPIDRSPTAIFMVQLNSTASGHSDPAGGGVPTVLCPNCHTLVKVPTDFTVYRCCNCLVYLQAETPASAPLPPKYGNAVGFIPSFFRKKRQMKFFRRSPNHETPVSASQQSKYGKAVGFISSFLKKKRQIKFFSRTPKHKTPVSAPLPPKYRKAVGFISSFFRKKGYIRFFRRAPNYEVSLAPSPSSDLTEQSVEEEHHAMGLGLTCVFSYKELKEATNDFHESRIIGCGGFGLVYLGELKDGRRVAVKRLFENNPKLLEQFFNEITALSRIHHENLVALYGCTNPQNRKMLLLVYEFVPNGNLSYHLHEIRPSLPWDVRIRIAIEIAEVLTYLYSLEPRIVHRDVKPCNILLDNAFHVKVADFGMCRLMPLDSTHVLTDVQGTLGYRDPEYDYCSKLSGKCDVYSFGVVMLELVSGKHAIDVNRDQSDIYLVTMGLNMIWNNQVELLVDPELGYHSKEEIRRMVDSVLELVCRCLHQAGCMRPPMIEVLMVLKSIGEMVKTEEASEVAFSGSNNILHASKIELGEAYSTSYLPCNSGFVVYQGKLTDGRNVKALKEHNSNRMEEFYKVVDSHSFFCHQNLVTLYGCQNQGSRELLLVYELLPNGNLADHLHGKHVAKGALTLDLRIQIAIDTAQALAYLHSFYPPVVHGTVKTDTILLDNNFSAKVVDLGLCHLLPTEKLHSKLSAKWDVYSFGVVLMELISGNRAVDINRECDEIHATNIDKKLKQLVDNKLGYGANSEMRWSVSSMAQLAFRCFQPNENNRPHMEEVLKVLKGIKEQQTILKGTSWPLSQSSAQRNIGQSSLLAE